MKRFGAGYRQHHGSCWDPKIMYQKMCTHTGSIHAHFHVFCSLFPCTGAVPAGWLLFSFDHGFNVCHFAVDKILTRPVSANKDFSDGSDLDSLALSSAVLRSLLDALGLFEIVAMTFRISLTGLAILFNMETIFLSSWL